MRLCVVGSGIAVAAKFDLLAKSSSAHPPLQRHQSKPVMANDELHRLLSTAGRKQRHYILFVHSCRCSADQGVKAMPAQRTKTQEPTPIAVVVRKAFGVLYGLIWLASALSWCLCCAAVRSAWALKWG